MKKYESLDLEVVRFAAEDVISTSDGPCDADICPNKGEYCPCLTK